MPQAAMDDAAPLADELAETEDQQQDKAPDAKESDDDAPEDKPGEEEAEAEDKDADDDSGEDDDDKAKDREEHRPRRRRSRRDRMISELRRENADIRRRLDEMGQQKPAEITEPREQDFANTNDYIKARDEWSREQGRREAATEAERKHKESEERRQAEEVSRRALTAIDKGRRKYTDFDTIALNPDNFDPSPEVASVIMESDQAHDVAYYLGKHPDEADRLETMTATHVAREIGRIEAKLATKPNVKPKVSAAPDPPNKIGPGKDAPTKSLEDVPYSEFVKRRRKGAT
jgi:hypothetical protein